MTPHTVGICSASSAMSAELLKRLHPDHYFCDWVGPMTTTIGIKLFVSTSRSTSCARRVTAVLGSSFIPFEPISTSVPTGQPVTARAVPRHSKAARSTCNSAMCQGTCTRMKGSSGASTARKWADTTARAEKTRPIAAEPCRAPEEAGGTRGKKRMKWQLLCGAQGLHSSSRRHTRKSKDREKGSWLKRRRQGCGDPRSSRGPGMCGLRVKAQTSKKPQQMVL